MSKHIPHTELSVPDIQSGIYEHYRGDRYEVVGAGLETETLAPVIIYKPLYESPVQLWVRPFEMFTESVEVDGKKVERFRRINE